MAVLTPPRYIDTEAELGAWARVCDQARFVAVDTESDSFHHYREKVCLVQMSANGIDALIDPLALGSLAPLASLFADPQRIKIFHDACYDLLCLGRDFGFQVQGLWDTMLASRMLGNTDFGLAAVLRRRFGFNADKRLQRSDWARRPLSAEQIEYARFDTHYLERLALTQRDELAARERLAWAEEDFARLPQVAARIASRNAASSPSFWRLRGVRHLPPGPLGRVRALFELRERLAQSLDRPPFKVFADALILDLALRPPSSRRELGPRPGLRRVGVERFGAEILAALKGAQPEPGRPPAGVRPRRRSGRLADPEARDRYEALRELRRASAAQLGLDPEVLVSNATLEELARQEPAAAALAVRALPELQGWRQPYLVDGLVAVLTGR